MTVFRFLRNKFVHGIVVLSMMPALFFSANLQEATHSFFHSISRTSCVAKTSLFKTSFEHRANHSAIDHDHSCWLRIALVGMSHNFFVFSESAFTQIYEFLDTGILIAQKHELQTQFLESNSARGPPELSL